MVNYKRKYEALINSAIAGCCDPCDIKEVVNSINFDTESDLYKEVRSMLGDRYDRMVEEWKENAKSDILRRIDSADVVDKSEWSFDHGDPVYDWNYFGFSLYRLGDTLELYTRAKYYNGKPCNPYHVDKYKGVSLQEAKEIMRGVCERAASTWSVSALSLKTMIDDVENKRM